MTFIERMMPGSGPYTPGEIDQVHALISDSADAQDLVVDIDELEQFARRMAFRATPGRSL